MLVKPLVHQGLLVLILFMYSNVQDDSALLTCIWMLFTCYLHVAVIPYMHYSRQSSMQKRGCVVAKLMAKLLAKSGMPPSSIITLFTLAQDHRFHCVHILAGICHILTLDLQHKEIHGFFDMPLDNLRASPVIINYIKHQVCQRGRCIQ